MLLFLLLLVPGAFAAMCNSAKWTDNDRRAIVDVHNQLRSRIARGIYVAKGERKPPAKNMMKMSYDCAIEAAAQKYADTCPTGHSSEREGRGENLYWLGSTANININGKGAAGSRAWESEFPRYGWPGVQLTPAAFGRGIGHATQMAWATTNKIGCGVKVCQPGRKMKRLKYEVVVVCQYGPGGNVMSYKIYEDGATCSQCPKGTRCERSTGLCA